MTLLTCQTLADFFTVLVKEIQDEKTAIQALTRIVIKTVNEKLLIAVKRDDKGKPVLVDGKPVQLDAFPYGNELAISVMEEYYKSHKEVFRGRNDAMKIVRVTVKQACSNAMEALSIKEWAEQVPSYVWQYNEELTTQALYKHITSKVTDPARQLRLAVQMAELSVLLKNMATPAAQAA